MLEPKVAYRTLIHTLSGIRVSYIPCQGYGITIRHQDDQIIPWHGQVHCLAGRFKHYSNLCEATYAKHDCKTDPVLGTIGSHDGAALAYLSASAVTNQWYAPKNACTPHPLHWVRTLPSTPRCTPLLPFVRSHSGRGRISPPSPAMPL